MTTDADRAAFETAYPYAKEWRDGDVYWGDYAGRWLAWTRALSHERARRAEACAGLVAIAEQARRDGVVSGETLYHDIMRVIDGMNS